ncbi:MULTISPECIES: thioredoxin family protein [Morganellaceae]|uniref:thioredoxin family protein n=1 Tax=Morganellaceae TaxID=1903414 RepID=UPI0018E496CE|nr:thioredoxin family protein [Providencia sp.]MBI6530065.1 thioredoxin [Proteus vulgaris]MBP6082210.1 thioredoxin [Providencia sp.]
MHEIIHYNEDNFRDIERYEGVSVVRFSAPWCPPCQASEAFFNAFINQLDNDVQAGKVNVDLAPVLTTKYEIWGLPSVLIFKEGQLIRRIPGVKSAAFYAGAIDDVKKGL